MAGKGDRASEAPESERKGMRAAWLIWAILAPTTAISQTGDPPRVAALVEQPRVLTAAGRVSFDIPMFGSVGRTYCDAAGDMVFDVGSLSNDRGPFLRVQSDGRSHVIYSLPAEAQGWGNIAPALTPGGVFYVLFENFRDYSLIRFKDDGSVDGTTSLQVPSGVNLLYLAVADNQIVFARGYRTSHEVSDTPRAGFEALFDASGRLVRDLSAMAPQFDKRALQTGPLDGDVIAGEDGRFYILDDKKVLALNQSGDVERELTLKKPSMEAHAVQVDFSKGLVSVIFHSVRRASSNEPASVQVRAILLNSQTGEQRGDFVFDSSSTGSVLCFNAQDGYSTMALSGGMAAKDIVPFR